MAKLVNEWHATAGPEGDEARFTFREATNQEINTLLSSRWEGKGGRKSRIRDTGAAARADLFDRLLVAVENLFDVDGTEINTEGKDRIPLKWKNDIIFQKYEEDETSVKNS